MDAETAVRTCLRKFVTFDGRAARPEFWWFALFWFVGNMILSVIDAVILPSDARLLSPIFSLAMFLPVLAVSIRRLHDINRTGWWVLLYVIPVIGFLVLLYFYVLKGDGGTNAYGPPPAR